MAAVQGGNLNDAYVQIFGQVLNGLLQRADFPAGRVTIQQLLDTVEPIALAATRRAADTVGDMSTVTPAVADFDLGFVLGSALYSTPQDTAPPPPYVAPTTVQTPGGSRVPFNPKPIGSPE